MKIKKQNHFKEKIIRKLLGLVYRLDNSANGFFDKNGEENFVNQFTDSVKIKNPVIFDVGANVGDYSELLVNRLTGANYILNLFEPQKSCFTDLQQKFGNNRNVTLNNFGLSNIEESAIIYKDEDKSGLTSLHKRNLDFYEMNMSIEEKIELKRADAYIQSKNIKHIDLLKIDVEGHELSTLAGFGKYLNSDFIDFIQFEYGGANMDSHTNLLDFYNLLIPLGFKITKVMPLCLELRDYNPRMDNFFYSNYVAVSTKVLASMGENASK